MVRLSGKKPSPGKTRQVKTPGNVKAPLPDEERLSQIVLGSPIPTFVIDAGHRITHCNRAFENLTGIPEDRILGTRDQWKAFYGRQRPVMADLIVDGVGEEEIRRHYGEKYSRSLVKGGAYEAEDFFPHLGEKGKWLFFTAAPLRNAEGKTIGAIETLQDVTERKRVEAALRKSEMYHRRLLDFLPFPTVVFSLQGTVIYLNPAFTETFGWTLEELKGRRIPYVPEDLKEETEATIRRVLHEKVLMRHVTKRLTKDGQVLDVAIRAAFYSGADEEPGGEIVILRDITREKRIARNNEAILRISTALPEYPDLGDLLDFISGEVRRLLDTEGALVIFHDQEKGELFFLGAAYDDAATQRRVKEIRFPLDRLVAGRVLITGEPLVVTDTSEDADLHRERDEKLGYRTRNLLLVPLRSSDRIIGVLCAINKKSGEFHNADEELLTMIAGTVALSIENARFSEELKNAYMEVSSMNRAKDRVINHLSHELKTPVSVILGSLNVIEGKLTELPDQAWRRTLERSRRSLERITEILRRANDIVQGKGERTYPFLSQLLDQCADELESLVAEEKGEGSLVDRLRVRIRDIFGERERAPERVFLHVFVRERLEVLRPFFPHRQIEIVSRIEDAPPILIPGDALEKVVDGLLRNAVENTPDEGRIEVLVQRKDHDALLLVHDYGVGITEDDRKRVFEGFFSTQNTMDYSSGSPFDFNAGGKGVDLLRMKIFSERYGFRINMASVRCRHIQEEGDFCPGRISRCAYCASTRDCFASGGTVFSLLFTGETK
ncbi:MAG: PAS domain S-box protein [Deltaproteobacteria bacterium]|nr:PAS domain S-box protein [Deltaproteobacteria bacterium]